MLELSVRRLGMVQPNQDAGSSRRETLPASAWVPDHSSDEDMQRRIDDWRACIGWGGR